MFKDYIRFTEEGPRVWVQDRKLSDKDVILLQLSPGEAAHLSGKGPSEDMSVSELETATSLYPKTIGSRLSELNKVGRRRAAGTPMAPGRYKVTTTGIHWLHTQLQKKFPKARSGLAGLRLRRKLLHVSVVPHRPVPEERPLPHQVDERMRDRRPVVVVSPASPSPRRTSESDLSLSEPSFLPHLLEDAPAGLEPLLAAGLRRRLSDDESVVSSFDAIPAMTLSTACWTLSAGEVISISQLPLFSLTVTFGGGGHLDNPVLSLLLLLRILAPLFEDSPAQSAEPAVAQDACCAILINQACCYPCCAT